MHGRIRRRLALLVAVASITTGYHGVPAPAMATTATTEPSTNPLSCYFEEEIVTSPGLSDQSKDYSYTTNGRGVARCVGMMAGETITGPGWFVDSGIGYGSCFEGSGYSHLTGAVPVKSGEMELDGFLHLTRAGTTGELHGFINGAFYVGSYAAVPSIGGSSCFDPGPTSGATVYGDAVLVVGAHAVTPPKPHSVATKVSGDRVTVSWHGGDEPGRPPVIGYHVYRNGKRFAELGVDARTTIDDGLEKGSYIYRVEAIGERYHSDHAVSGTAVVRYSGP